MDQIDQNGTAKLVDNKTNTNDPAKESKLTKFANQITSCPKHVRSTSSELSPPPTKLHLICLHTWHTGKEPADCKLIHETVQLN